MTFYKELGKKLRDHHEHIDSKVEDIEKYRKYVNTELEYCCLTMTLSKNLSITSNTVIPFNTVKESNMEYDIKNNYSVKLKAGKTYKILVDYIIAGGFGTTHIYDITNAKRVGTFVKVANNVDSGVSTSSGAVIYTPDTDCEIQAVVTWVSSSPTITTSNAFGHFIVEEIGREIIIDPLEHVNTTQGIEDTPVGHIISHMGTIAPKHYLICDGAEYNIEDYPYLAQHIEDNFGTINYFGGDGVNTFAVPDLRGEFLRGTGGAGGEVGEHQEGTQHQNFYGDSNDRIIALANNTNSYSNGNSDAIISSANRGISITGTKSTAYSGQAKLYTSRPTNTAVLYCIKYEPTYFMNTYNTNYIQPSMYSLEEKVVGNWVNGKPLYQKTIYINTLVGQGSNLDICTINNVNIIDAHGVQYWYGNNQTEVEPIPHARAIFRYIPELGVLKYMNNSTAAYTIEYVTIQYTKTTDEENSFTNDILKDSYVELTYSNEEISNMVSDILGGEE